LNQSLIAVILTGDELGDKMSIHKPCGLLLPTRLVALIGVAFAVLITACAHSDPSTRYETLPEIAEETIVQPLSDNAARYTIGAGDVLEISVWKDAALSRTLIVLPDGSISFPLLGRVHAEGKTADQLKSDMAGKLVNYIPEPEISVIVQRVNSQVVYIIGKVNRPGPIELSRKIDVLQALSIAGGLNMFADKADIRIFRKTEDQTMVIPFNYKAVTEEYRLEENILLQRGDVVLVK
jgi:polysaccharide export outer membrane protein